MYDVVIVGLGPAGATLAAQLPAQMKVLAIDRKSDGADSFRKPCGGLLAPDAQKVLARLDLTLPKELLVDPQIFAVRTIDLASGLTRHYQRFYLNMDRHKFDRWLISRIPSGVERWDNSRLVDAQRTEEGFRLTVHTETGEERTITTRTLVGADGAYSRVRQIFYPDHKIRQYTAIQQWFEPVDPNPFYSCIFDPENTDCYSWSIYKDGAFVFGGAYPIENSRMHFENQKKKLAAQGFVFGPPLRTEACAVLRPASPWEFCLGEKNLFLIGEAAGFISPSSLEGISSAFRTALALCQALESPNPERDYRRRTRTLRLQLSLKLLKCPFLYQPILRRMVMQSRLNALPQEATEK